jgi:hypothetical protein
MQNEGDVLTIRAPGSNKLFFAIWIVFSILATLAATATIDPGLFGLSQVAGIVTAGPPDHPHGS